MDESTIRSEVRSLLYAYGFLCDHPPDMSLQYDKNKTQEQRSQQQKEALEEARVKQSKGVGKIDLIALNPVGPSILVECKKITMENGPVKGHNGSIRFDAISLAQRRTLDRWCFPLAGDAFLAIGTIDSAEQRRLWIIPWKEWVEKELKICSDTIKGLPVYSKQGLGLVDLFPTSECKWIGTKTDVHWDLPDWHVIPTIRAWKPRPDDEMKIHSLRF